MIYGSLFSGIGGIDLGLDRAGMTCRWQVEKDDYALQVLKRHWPDVPKYRDVRTFLGSKRWRRARSAWTVDLIAGGFPCQDVSWAGPRIGIQGNRSGLWGEFARIVRLLRPKFLLVENVPGLLHRGLGRVLGDLATLGYDAEWDCIPAAAVGAPHIRWRVFIVARPDALNSASLWSGQRGRKQFAAYCAEKRDLYWPQSKSDAPRVLNGIPFELDGVANRGDRLRCIGNAVVPQIAQWIGEWLMETSQ